MEELDTDEYIRRIKALNAIKDQYEFTTSIQVTIALQSTKHWLYIDYETVYSIFFNSFSLSSRLGLVQICCSGTFLEKRSFQMRQTLLLGDVITPESPLYLHLQDHGDGAILGQT